MAARTLERPYSASPAWPRSCPRSVSARSSADNELDAPPQTFRFRQRAMAPGLDRTLSRVRERAPRSCYDTLCIEHSSHWPSDDRRVGRRGAP